MHPAESVLCRWLPRLARSSVAVLLPALLAGAAAARGQEAPPPGDASARVIKLTAGEETKLPTVKGASGVIDRIEIVDHSLKAVLEYLKAVGNVNITVLPEKEGDTPITLSLQNVTYRGVLEFIARKYGFTIDDSKIKDKLIFLTRPEKVVLIFRNAPIEDVINSISMQANANIVVSPEVKGNISMRLENVPWQEALQIVVKTLDFVVVQEPNDTLRITTKDKLQSQLETRIFRLAYLTPEGAKYTATISSEFAKAEGSKETTAAGSTLIDVLAKMKTPQGTLAFVKQANALVVTDIPTRLDQMEAIINRLDVAPKQIHVAVKVVALTDGDTERLGVNWSSGIQFKLNPVSAWASAFPFDVSHGLSNSLLGRLAVGQGVVYKSDPEGGGTPVAYSDIMTLKRAHARYGIQQELTNPADQPVVSAPTPIALGSMGFGTTNAVLEMIRTKTSGRVIQAPQLVTLDNESATIQVGRLFRYAESFVANTEGGGNVSGFREAAGSPIKLGIQLLIIPHVTGPENNIMMTVVPKTEEIYEIKTIIGPQGEQLLLPDTIQRIVVTKMLLRNGETGVIGGLRTEADQRTQNSVPLLGDIPMLGRLFKHRSRTVNGENLMVFVTPTIVDLELRDDFTKQLDKLRQDLSKPFAPLGEEEAAPEPAAKSS